MFCVIYCKLGIEYFDSWCKVRTADILAQNLYYAYERLDKLGKVKNIYQEIKDNQLAFTIKDLNINGQDLIDCNVCTQGKEVGTTLNNLLSAVMNEEIINDFAELMLYAKKQKEGHRINESN